MPKNKKKEEEKIVLGITPETLGITPRAMFASHKPKGSLKFLKIL